MPKAPYTDCDYHLIDPDDIQTEICYTCTHYYVEHNAPVCTGTTLYNRRVNPVGHCDEYTPTA